MKIDAKRFRVAQRSSVDLRHWPTAIEPLYASDDDYQERLQKQVKILSEQQELLSASRRYAILVIFEAMDAGGKDSAIEHVMSGINPQGCRVTSFKPPGERELRHDFLWRAIAELPERGSIGIFNRSYYEEVLILRVHPERLRAEGLPGPASPKKIWQERYRSITDLERHLTCNATRVIKFFLHVSKDQQRDRFIDRIDNPQKNWKLCLDDIEERKFWREYMKAYAKCISATSTTHAPWHIVPADDKRNVRLIVSNIILDTLRQLELSYPKTSAKRRRQLSAVRKNLLR
jgi:PPK2 family polyphosphate:nucleotide phosphotransferase